LTILIVSCYQRTDIRKFKLTYGFVLSQDTAYSLDFADTGRIFIFD